MSASPAASARGRETFRHGDLTAAALREAVALCHEGGAAAVSLRKVAQRAGVAHRALYTHYDGKDGLMAAVAGEAFGLMAGAVAGAADEAGFARAYLRFALGEPHLYDVAMSRHGRTGGPAAGAMAVIEHARAATGFGDEAIKRLWMRLHGGLTLHRAGILTARSDEALVDYLVGGGDA